MGIFTSCWCIDLAVLFIGAFVGVYYYYQKKFKHWAKLGIPHTKPKFPFGNIGKAGIKESIVVSLDRVYKSFENEKVVGTWSFFRPILVPRDVEVLKDMLVKEFMSFANRGMGVNDEDDPLSGNLLNLDGPKWKNMRAKLSPTFTSGKMKMMFPILVQCGNEMVTVLERNAVNKDIVEMKDLLARFTTDVIASCAFGIDSNSLKNPDVEFRKMGTKILEPSLTNFFRLFLLLIPKLPQLLKISAFPSELRYFFLKVVRETIDYREKNNVKRNDFMQLLIQLKNKGTVDVDEIKESESDEKKNVQKFTVEDATGQALLFFIAGFETSSTTMAFALYELALHPEIQEKLRNEIKRDLAKHNREITYEAVFGMEYLGNVIDETLRKYPVTGVLLRESSKEYKIPDSDMIIPKGTPIQIPIYSIHYDPKFYPDPQRFDPNRFKEEIKSQRHRFAYLPFGEGPRNCIGMRFALMQVRVGLIKLLLNYKFEICEKSPVPLVFGNLSLTPKEGMHLRISKVS